MNNTYVQQLIARVDVQMERYIFRATRMGDRIATARDTVPALRSTPTLTLTDWFKLEAMKICLYSLQPGFYPRTIQARILYGRWVVDCPECPGCNDADPAEPVYLCTSCGFPEQLVRVEFPDRRAEIERLLLKRKHIANRNWRPGETLAQLRQQNIQNGDEV
jgi:hypothetical protein